MTESKTNLRASVAYVVGAGWYVWLVFVKSEENTRGSEDLLAFSLLVRAGVLEIPPLIKPARTSGTLTPTQGVRMRTAMSPGLVFCRVSKVLHTNCRFLRISVPNLERTIFVRMWISE